VFAVQAQKWIERFGAAKHRREEIFKSLMATRGAVLSPRHVEALNMIDLEFRGARFRSVREAWRSYLDHLNTHTGDDTSAQIWLAKSPDLLAALLSAMAKALGFDFGNVDIKKSWYAPMQHFRDEDEQRQLRGQLLKALKSGALAIEVPPPQHRPGEPPSLKE
jgi:hypothetical protein